MLRFAAQQNVRIGVPQLCRAVSVFIIQMRDRKCKQIHGLFRIRNSAPQMQSAVFAVQMKLFDGAVSGELYEFLSLVREEILLDLLGFCVAALACDGEIPR